MRARFHDGLTAASRMVEVSAAAGALIFSVDGADFRWPLREVQVETVGELTRISHKGAARLIVETAAWKAVAGSAASSAGRRSGRREVRLVLALAAAGLAVAAFVFFGVPALSGPLARATPPALEQQIGANFSSQVEAIFPVCEGDDGQSRLGAFGLELEHVSGTPFALRVLAVEAPMVNAFALPGGTVLVTDDLIEEAEGPDEVAAVIAHEVAHIERRHVMQVVWRNLGLGLVLDAVVGGGTGAGQQAVLLAGQVTELRYSREAEAEADALGQALLHRAGYSSRGMASFFARLGGGDEERAGGRAAELVSSHPDTARRAAAARARERPGRAAFDPEAWAEIRAACTAPDRPRFRLGGSQAGTDAE